MGKVAGLTILGLMVAIALDGLYAKLMNMPWGMGQSPEVLRVEVPMEAGAIAPVADSLEVVENPDEHTIHLIWTEPSAPAPSDPSLTPATGQPRTITDPTAYTVDDLGITRHLVTQ